MIADTPHPERNPSDVTATPVSLCVSVFVRLWHQQPSLLFVFVFPLSTWPLPLRACPPSPSHPMSTLSPPNPEVEDKCVVLGINGEGVRKRDRNGNVGGKEQGFGVTSRPGDFNTTVLMHLLQRVCCHILHTPKNSFFLRASSVYCICS